jgi:hypothetical protein
MADTKKDLKELIAKRRELEREMKALDGEAASLQKKLAPKEAEKLVGAIQQMAKLFIDGAVAKAFDKVQFHLATLSLYESKYLQKVLDSKGVPKHLGLDFGPQTQFICEVLLNGRLVPNTRLWSFLGKLVELQDQKNNPFMGGDDV